MKDNFLSCFQKWIGEILFYHVDSQITYVADQLCSREYLNFFTNKSVPEEKVKRNSF